MTSRLSKHATYGGGHAYRLIDAEGKSQRVPSVSGIKSTLHQFNNDAWRVGQVVDVIDEQWRELSELAPTSRHAAMLAAGKARLSEAAEFGRAVHHYAEHLWTGEPVEVPPQYAGHVSALARFWELHSLTALAVEAMAFADEDEFKGGAVAGTLDLLVSHPRYGPGILDIKTWRAQSSGTPRPQEWAFQLVAYADMDYLVHDGRDVAFPATNWCGVVHVGPGGARLWTVTADGYLSALAQVHSARQLKSLPHPKMLETEW